MATTQQAPERIDSLEPLESSTTNVEKKPVDVENLNEKPPAKDEQTTTSDASHDSNNMDLSSTQGHLGSSDAVSEDRTVYPSNIFAPQAHSFFERGFGNPIGDEYSQYLNAEVLEVGSAGAYNENPSLVYHTAYGYGPQMPYGPYSPVTTPVPSISGHGQLYSHQQFQFPGTYYHHPAPNMPYLSSPTPIPQADLTVPIDQQGAFPVDTSNFNTQLFGPRPSYHLPYGSFGRDWLRSPEGTGSVAPLSSPAASPQPMGALMSFGQSTMPLTFGMVNASAHFCGVAEMVGPVDFEKSVDYWQQDKWSGQFPVKWHIVKDVHNNLFRHIILENNDNKPVTNSRDTQEVKLEQGLEMLSIFKKHEYEVSILDDFKFYEEREKAMQERKAHQQQQQLSNSVGPGPAARRDDRRKPTAISGGLH